MSRDASIGIRSLVAALLLACAAADGVEIETLADGVAIRGPTQRFRAERGADGAFALRSEVRVTGPDGGDRFAALFDAGLPLVTGPDFDLRADAARAESVGAGRAALLLEGIAPLHGFPWRARVELSDGSSLARLRVECDLREPVILRGLEPCFALWMERPTVAFALDQGTASIDAGSADRQWGNSFPAAILWDDGVEAAMFVVGESLDWMSPRNLYRFRDCRVASWSDADAGRTALGLRVVTRSFHELPAGTVAFEAWLHAAPAPRPSRPEALGRIVRRFAPLHPASAPPLVDRLTGRPSSWTEIARGVDADLRRGGVVRDEVTLPADAPWSDAPLFPEDSIDRLPIATDYALASSCDPARDRARVADGWDFSTCHNGLAQWLVHDRLHPDADRRRLLLDTVRGMRMFLDVDLRLLRHGTRVPPHVGDREMAWQNLLFAIETARVHGVLDSGAHAPVVGGTALLAADGLVEMWRESDGLVPQWFDPVTKRALPQGDQPDLGVVHEPWQAGSLAWLLTEAHAIDGRTASREAACAAIERLLGPLRYRVTNARYDVLYDCPTRYPVTEIFGQAWGVAACCRLRALTGDDVWDDRGDLFLDTLLRLTPWYESALRDDPRDIAVRNAGLFRNHGCAFTGSPWENAETALALTVRVRDDVLRGRAPREPLLAILNLQRVNAATFFPRACPPEALACPRLADHPAASLPIEDAYTPEHGGLHGGMGLAAYMAGSAFAWDLLFEALGRSDDPSIMLLNLDAIEGVAESLAGLERRFVAFNPLDEPRRTSLALAALPPGRYRITVGRGPAEERSHEALAAGVTVDLPPRGFLAVSIERVGADGVRAARARRRAACAALATEWADLHRALVAEGMTAALEARRDAWRVRMADFLGDVDAAP